MHFGKMEQIIDLTVLTYKELTECALCLYVNLCLTFRLINTKNTRFSFFSPLTLPTHQSQSLPHGNHLSLLSVCGSTAILLTCFVWFCF